jgi:uncharacterized protein related to proFAR isomerase
MESFAIIPVLDLKAGEVVRARAGDRARYRPIVTPLASSSRARDVLSGLLDLAPFRTVYIADLDAIAGEGDHRSEILRLSEDRPGVEFWVDAGFATRDEALWTVGTRIVPVFGTESLAAPMALPPIAERFGDRGFVLSLDYRGEQFLGPAEIERQPDLWPQRIILMTLARVGMNAGPAHAELRRLAAKAHPRAVFAAGGVRDAGDLDELRGHGITGALVASALHDGRLPGAVLRPFLG